DVYKRQVAASGVRAPKARPSWRAVWTYALLLTFTAAFTPIVWPIALVLGVATLLVRVVVGRGEALLAHVLRFLAVVGTPLIALAPWSLTLLTHPSRFLTEAGLDYGHGTATALKLLSIDPGGPKTFGGLLLLGIVLAALAALLRGDRQPAVRCAWAAALTGLLFAALANGSGWAGP
ncbi:hypothetical protein ADK38_30095, partial [Streptomyces varsoviensis]